MCVCRSQLAYTMCELKLCGVVHRWEKCNEPMVGVYMEWCMKWITGNKNSPKVFPVPGPLLSATKVLELEIDMGNVKPIQQGLH